jgi:outer membrane protein TolC
VSTVPDFSKRLALFVLVGVLTAGPVAVTAQVSDTVPSGRPAEDTASVAGQLVSEALESNLALQQRRIGLEQARAALAEARGRYLPRLDVSARYSRAEGGRTIDIPVGDLVNPVYRTLNDLTGTTDFPQIDNEEIPFLRSTEQETVLRLQQPIVNPSIVYGSRARRHRVRAERAGVAAFRRELIRDVRVAYFRYRQAQTRVDVLQSAGELARENRRTNLRLVSAERATQEAVYRAEVDVLEVRQQLDEAHAAVDRARRYLNVLRNRPPETAIPPSRIDAQAQIRRQIGALDPSLRRRISAGADRSESLLTASRDGNPVHADRPGDGLRLDPWIHTRPELEQLGAAIDAAESQRRLAQSDYFPTVSLAVEAGIQGADYGFSGERPFVLGSVVLSWNLFDGFQDRRAVQQRRLEVDRLRTRRADVAQQIGLEVRSALDDVQVARRSLETAEARVRAARETFRLTSRRHDAGRATQIELTDARTTRTDAELNLNRTRYTLLIRLAELDYAFGKASVDI